MSGRCPLSADNPAWRYPCPVFRPCFQPVCRWRPSPTSRRSFGIIKISNPRVGVFGYFGVVKLVPWLLMILESYQEQIERLSIGIAIALVHFIAQSCVLTVGKPSTNSLKNSRTNLRNELLSRIFFKHPIRYTPAWQVCGVVFQSRSFSCGGSFHCCALRTPGAGALFSNCGSIVLSVVGTEVTKVQRLPNHHIEKTLDVWKLRLCWFRCKQ